MLEYDVDPVFMEKDTARRIVKRFYPELEEENADQWALSLQRNTPKLWKNLVDTFWQEHINDYSADRSR